MAMKAKTTKTAGKKAGAKKKPAKAMKASSSSTKKSPAKKAGAKKLSEAKRAARRYSFGLPPRPGSPATICDHRGWRWGEEVSAVSESGRLVVRTTSRAPNAPSGCAGAARRLSPLRSANAHTPTKRRSALMIFEARRTWIVSERSVASAAFNQDGSMKTFG